MMVDRNGEAPCPSSDNLWPGSLEMTGGPGYSLLPRAAGLPADLDFTFIPRLQKLLSKIKMIERARIALGRKILFPRSIADRKRGTT